MSASGAGYDLSTTTFSPDGRVFQVEYANKAVEKSGTCVGVRCVDGVVLGVEKIVTSKMLLDSSNKRIHTVDMHSGIALCGLSADARQLVNIARTESSNYRNFYGSPIPANHLCERVAGHMHSYTLYWYMRPYGASVLLATYDKDGPALHMIEPSGVAYRYFGAAVGKHKQGAKGELEKLDFKKVTCREAVKHVARIIYKLHDDIKDKNMILELSWVCDESQRKHVVVPSDLRAEAIKLALEEKKKEEQDSDSDEDEDEDDEEKKKKKDAAEPAESAPEVSMD